MACAAAEKRKYLLKGSNELSLKKHNPSIVHTEYLSGKRRKYLLNAYSFSGTLHKLFIILKKILQERFYYPHFTDEEDQGSEIVYSLLRLHI